MTKNYNAHKVFPQKRPGGDLSRSSNTGKGGSSNKFYFDITIASKQNCEIPI